MLYVLRHFHTFLDLDPGFRATLHNLTFLPRKDMFLTTDRFYDPDSDLLQKLFIGTVYYVFYCTIPLTNCAFV